MSVRSFQYPNWTPTLVADAAAITTLTAMVLRGGSTTQLIKIEEIFISGMAPSAPAPTPLVYAHESTIAGTITTLAAPATDGFMHPSATGYLAASVPIPFIAWTVTSPQRSAAVSDPKINCGLNTFGGLVKWNPAPGQEFYQLGNVVTAPSGECCLSAQNFGTAGLVTSHILYEVQ